MLIKIKKNVKLIAKINGIYGKKLKPCYGRKLALIIVNGIILRIVAKMRMKKIRSLLCLNMIPLFKLWKLT